MALTIYLLICLMSNGQLFSSVGIQTGECQHPYGRLIITSLTIIANNREKWRQSQCNKRYEL